MNLKKVYLLCRVERLTVRKRGGRKRALGTRAPMTIPQKPTQRWSLEFVSYALACGQRFGDLTDHAMAGLAPGKSGGGREGEADDAGGDEGAHVAPVSWQCHFERLSARSPTGPSLQERRRLGVAEPGCFIIWSNGAP